MCNALQFLCQPKVFGIPRLLDGRTVAANLTPNQLSEKTTMDKLAPLAINQAPRPHRKVKKTWDPAQ